eukprot:CAMPEP_0114147812 /NCGR_PEP_ID=MMETSP0043_2-20121206/21303_1 /TAXON_ID=464988 /ORGANISM="Hemiselmis andersenii, Strain CCMP644" /LENGTH=112 /DNA_ID=CAMNT_0001242369 /DNA_START=98 /DNA_END=436 /DNA_ORIENTATION=+
MLNTLAICCPHNLQQLRQTQYEARRLARRLIDGSEVAKHPRKQAPWGALRQLDAAKRSPSESGEENLHTVQTHNFAFVEDVNEVVPVTPSPPTHCVSDPQQKVAWGIHSLDS